MSASPTINVLLAVRQHIDDEIDATSEEIAETVAKLNERREHLQTLRAVRIAARCPERSARAETSATPSLHIA